MRKFDFDKKNGVKLSFSRRITLFTAIIAFCGFFIIIVGNAVKPFALTSIMLLSDETKEKILINESIHDNSLLSYALKNGRLILSPSFLPLYLYEGGFFAWGNGKDAVSPSDRLILSEDVFIEMDAPKDSLPVIKTTLYAPETLHFIEGVYINNESGKEIDIIPQLITLEKNSEEPQVLIYHTHGTESYNPGYSFYGGGVYNVNSTNTEENVVRMGEIIAAVLEKNGVKVIHLTDMFDYQDYANAYTRSREAAQKVLDSYPSIKIVIDVHRDTVIQSDGTKIRTVAEGENGDLAQLMILVGTGRSGYDVPNWRQNLAFAVAVAKIMSEENNEIMRPIMLRATHYNQQLSVGSILLEVGTCGNSLAEAERSALLFAEVLSKNCILG